AARRRVCRWRTVTIDGEPSFPTECAIELVHGHAADDERGHLLRSLARARPFRLVTHEPVESHEAPGAHRAGRRRNDRHRHGLRLRWWRIAGVGHWRAQVLPRHAHGA